MRLLSATRAEDPGHIGCMIKCASAWGIKALMWEQIYYPFLFFTGPGHPLLSLTVTPMLDYTPSV